MDDEAGHGIVAADDDCAENTFRQIRSDAEDIRQVAVHFIDEPVVIPSLSRPKPLPARPANERTYENHRDPQDDETEQKRADGEFALLPGVIAAAKRIRINVRNDHEAEDDECWHNNAS